MDAPLSKVANPSSVVYDPLRETWLVAGDQSIEIIDELKGASLAVIGNIKTVPDTNTPYSSTSKKGKFELDAVNKGSGFTITNEKTCFEKTSSDMQSLFGTAQFDTGKHYWEVNIEKFTPNEDFFLGVVHPGASCYSSPRYDPSWYVLNVTQGTIFGYDVADTPYCEPVKEGDTVGLYLDMEKKTLTFFINGQSKGVAIHSFTDPKLVASISIQNRHSKGSLDTDPIKPLSLSDESDVFLKYFTMAPSYLDKDRCMLILDALPVVQGTANVEKQTETIIKFLKKPPLSCTLPMDDGSTQGFAVLTFEASDISVVTSQLSASLPIPDCKLVTFDTFKTFFYLDSSPSADKLSVAVRRWLVQKYKTEVKLPSSFDAVKQLLTNLHSSAPTSSVSMTKEDSSHAIKMYPLPNSPDVFLVIKDSYAKLMYYVGGRYMIDSNFFVRPLSGGDVSFPMTVNELSVFVNGSRLDEWYYKCGMSDLGANIQEFFGLVCSTLESASVDSSLPPSSNDRFVYISIKLSLLSSLLSSLKFFLEAQTSLAGDSKVGAAVHVLSLWLNRLVMFTQGSSTSMDSSLAQNNSEMFRLLSFAFWPLRVPSPRDLAALGYVFKGSPTLDSCGHYLDRVLSDDDWALAPLPSEHSNLPSVYHSIGSNVQLLKSLVMQPAFCQGSKIMFVSFPKASKNRKSESIGSDFVILGSANASICILNTALGCVYVTHADLRDTPLHLHSLNGGAVVDLSKLTTSAPSSVPKPQTGLFNFTSPALPTTAPWTTTTTATTTPWYSGGNFATPAPPAAEPKKELDDVKNIFLEELELMGFPRKKIMLVLAKDSVKSVQDAVDALCSLELDDDEDDDNLYFETALKESKELNAPKTPSDPPLDLFEFVQKNPPHSLLDPDFAGEDDEESVLGENLFGDDLEDGGNDDNDGEESVSDYHSTGTGDAPEDIDQPDTKLNLAPLNVMSKDTKADASPLTSQVSSQPSQGASPLSPKFPTSTGKNTSQSDESQPSKSDTVVPSLFDESTPTSVPAATPVTAKKGPLDWLKTFFAASGKKTELKTDSPTHGLKGLLLSPQSEPSEFDAHVLTRPTLGTPATGDDSNAGSIPPPPPLPGQSPSTKAEGSNLLSSGLGSVSSPSSSSSLFPLSADSSKFVGVFGLAAHSPDSFLTSISFLTTETATLARVSSVSLKSHFIAKCYGSRRTSTSVSWFACKLCGAKLTFDPYDAKSANAIPITPQIEKKLLSHLLLAHRDVLMTVHPLSHNAQSKSISKGVLFQMKPIQDAIFPFGECQAVTYSAHTSMAYALLKPEVSENSVSVPLVAFSVHEDSTDSLTEYLLATYTGSKASNCHICKEKNFVTETSFHLHLVNKHASELHKEMTDSGFKGGFFREHKRFSVSLPFSASSLNATTDVASSIKFVGSVHELVQTSLDSSSSPISPSNSDTLVVLYHGKLFAFSVTQEDASLIWQQQSGSDGSPFVDASLKPRDSHSPATTSGNSASILALDSIGKSHVFELNLTNDKDQVPDAQPSTSSNTLEKFVSSFAAPTQTHLERIKEILTPQDLAVDASGPALSFFESRDTRHFKDSAPGSQSAKFETSFDVSHVPVSLTNDGLLFDFPFKFNDPALMSGMTLDVLVHAPLKSLQVKHKSCAQLPLDPATGDGMSSPLKFKVVSTDGGEYSAQHNVNNICKDDATVYCSKRPSANLILQHAEGKRTLVRSIQIRAPLSGFTAPIGEALVFVFDRSRFVLEQSKAFDNFTKADYDEYVKAKQTSKTLPKAWEPVGHIVLAPNTDEGKATLDFPRFGSFVLVKLLRSQAGTSSSNIDISYIGFGGLVHSPASASSFTFPLKARVGLPDLENRSIDFQTSTLFVMDEPVMIPGFDVDFQPSLIKFTFSLSHLTTTPIRSGRLQLALDPTFSSLLSNVQFSTVSFRAHGARFAHQYPDYPSFTDLRALLLGDFGPASHLGKVCSLVVRQSSSALHVAAMNLISLLISLDPGASTFVFNSMDFGQLVMENILLDEGLEGLSTTLAFLKSLLQLAPDAKSQVLTVILELLPKIPDCVATSEGLDSFLHLLDLCCSDMDTEARIPIFTTLMQMVVDLGERFRASQSVLYNVLQSKYGFASLVLEEELFSPASQASNSSSKTTTSTGAPLPWKPAYNSGAVTTDVDKQTVKFKSLADHFLNVDLLHDCTIDEVQLSVRPTVYCKLTVHIYGWSESSSAQPDLLSSSFHYLRVSDQPSLTLKIGKRAYRYLQFQFFATGGNTASVSSGLTILGVQGSSHGASTSVSIEQTRLMIMNAEEEYQSHRNEYMAARHTIEVPLQRLMSGDVSVVTGSSNSEFISQLEACQSHQVALYQASRSLRRLHAEASSSSLAKLGDGVFLDRWGVIASKLVNQFLKPWGEACRNPLAKDSGLPDTSALVLFQNVTQSLSLLELAFQLFESLCLVAPSYLRSSVIDLLTDVVLPLLDLEKWCNFAVTCLRRYFSHPLDSLALRDQFSQELVFDLLLKIIKKRPVFNEHTTNIFVRVLAEELSVFKSENSSTAGIVSPPPLFGWGLLLVLEDLAARQTHGEAHIGSTCASCHISPIYGTRFRCGHCLVDLCEKCEAKGSHDPDHVFLKISEPLPLAPNMSSANSAGPLLPKLYPPQVSTPAASSSTEQVKHVGYHCEFCGAKPIVGVRLTCANCDDYHLCEKCENKASHFPGQWHVFLKIKRLIPQNAKGNPSALIRTLLHPMLYPTSSISPATSNQPPSSSSSTTGPSKSPARLGKKAPKRGGLERSLSLPAKSYLEEGEGAYDDAEGESPRIFSLPMSNDEALDAICEILVLPQMIQPNMNELFYLSLSVLLNLIPSCSTNAVNKALFAKPSFQSFVQCAASSSNVLLCNCLIQVLQTICDLPLVVSTGASIIGGGSSNALTLSSDDESSSDEEDLSPVYAPTRGRGRGRGFPLGRGGFNASSRGRGSSSAVSKPPPSQITFAKPSPHVPQLTALDQAAIQRVDINDAKLAIFRIAQSLLLNSGDRLKTKKPVQVTFILQLLLISVAKFNPALVSRSTATVTASKAPRSLALLRSKSVPASSDGTPEAEEASQSEAQRFLDEACVYSLVALIAPTRTWDEASQVWGLVFRLLSQSDPYALISTKQLARPLEVCLRASFVVQTSVKNDLTELLRVLLARSDLAASARLLIFTELVRALPSVLVLNSDTSLFVALAQLLKSSTPFESLEIPSSTYVSFFDAIAEFLQPMREGYELSSPGTAWRKKEEALLLFVDVASSALSLPSCPLAKADALDKNPSLSESLASILHWFLSPAHAKSKLWLIMKDLVASISKLSVLAKQLIQLSLSFLEYGEEEVDVSALASLYEQLFLSEETVLYFAFDLKGLNVLSSKLQLAAGVDQLSSTLTTLIRGHPSVSSFTGPLLSDGNESSLPSVQTEFAHFAELVDVKSMVPASITELDLQDILDDNTEKTLGQESIVWLHSGELGGKVNIVLELPVYVNVDQVRVGACSNSKPDPNHTIVLPQTIELEVGPTLGTLIACGNFVEAPVPISTSMKSSNNRSVLMHMFSSSISRSVGPIRFVKLTLHYPSVLVEKDVGKTPSISLAKISFLGSNVLADKSPLEKRRDAFLRIFAQIYQPQFHKAHELFASSESSVSLLSIVPVLSNLLMKHQSLVKAILVPLASSSEALFDALFTQLLNINSLDVHASLVFELCRLNLSVASARVVRLQTFLFHELGVLKDSLGVMRIEPFLKAYVRTLYLQGSSIDRSLSKADLSLVLNWITRLELNTRVWDSFVRLLCALLRICSSPDEFIHSLFAHVITMDASVLLDQKHSSLLYLFGIVVSGHLSAARLALSSGLISKVVDHLTIFFTEEEPSPTASNNVVLALEFLTLCAHHPLISKWIGENFLETVLMTLNIQSTSGDNNSLIQKAAIKLFRACCMNNGDNQVAVGQSLARLVIDSERLNTFLFRTVLFAATTNAVQSVCIANHSWDEDGATVVKDRYISPFPGTEILTSRELATTANKLVCETMKDFTQKTMWRKVWSHYGEKPTAQHWDGFLQHCCNQGPILIVIETEQGEHIGGFCSSDLMLPEAESYSWTPSGDNRSFLCDFDQKWLFSADDTNMTSFVSLGKDYADGGYLQFGSDGAFYLSFCDGYVNSCYKTIQYVCLTNSDAKMPDSYIPAKVEVWGVNRSASSGTVASVEKRSNWLSLTTPLRFHCEGVVYEVPLSCTLPALSRAVGSCKTLALDSTSEADGPSSSSSSTVVATDEMTLETLIASRKFTGLLRVVESEKDVAQSSEDSPAPTLSILRIFDTYEGTRKLFDLALRRVQESKDMSSWTGFLQSLYAWAALPSFTEYFMASEECRTLLFQLLGLEEKKIEVASPHKLIYATAVQMFSSSSDSLIRDKAIELGLIKDIFAQFDTLSKESPRRFGAQEDEKKDETKSDVSSVSPVKTSEPVVPTPSKDSLPFGLFDEPMYTTPVNVNKKKGVGYGSDEIGGAHATKWDPSVYIKAEEERRLNLTEYLDFFASFCLPGDRVQWNPSEGFAQMILSSSLLPFLESCFRNDSLLDMGKSSKMYCSCLKLVRNIASVSSLRILLDDIGTKWIPRQTHSIRTLLGKLNGLSDVFLKCLGQTGASLDDAQNTLVEQLARDIQATYAAVVKSGEARALDRQSSLVELYDTLPVPILYRQILSDKRFGYMSMKEKDSKVYNHHYEGMISSSSSRPSREKLVRLAQELADISNALPIEETNAIFLRVDEDRVDVMKALIVGATGTPYAGGCFEFDIFCDDSYPSKPPKVNLCTTGNGSVRFNPNLYNCGKVCLSLLGTWRGTATENWDPKLSTLLQVLCSIQAMIMTDDIYFNEPGYENTQGTDEGERANNGYSNIVKFANVKFAMHEQLKNPSKGFEDAIRNHFYIKRFQIIEQIEAWLKHAQDKPASYDGLISDHNHEWCSKFKVSPTAYTTMLKAEIDSLRKDLLEMKPPIPQLDLEGNKPSELSSSTSDKPAVSTTEIVAEAEKEVSFGVGEGQVPEEREFTVDDSAVKDRWSRYIGAMGIEAVKKQSQSSVFISGLGALGAELAKNMILSGARRVTLHDTALITERDLCGHFALREADIGQNRAKVSASRLQELNLYVRVDATDVPLEEASLASLLDPYHMVVLVGAPFSLQLAMDKVCRERGIFFTSCAQRGLYSYIFNDFGEKFTVVDKDGEEIRELVMAGIEAKDGKAHITTLGRHDLQDGDTVLLREIGGSHPLNNTVHKIQVTTKNEITVALEADISLPPYVSGGLVLRQKMPISISFSSLDSCMYAPKADEQMHLDFTKMSHPMLSHLCFLAVDEFALSHDGRLPLTWGPEDAQAMVALVTDISKKFKDYELPDKWETFVLGFSHTCQGVLPPLCAALGGILAQECIKALTGKFVPITQWMYVDVHELLPASPPALNVPSRYLPLVSCIGDEVHDTLSALKLFLVGAGAVGCELLKNYAMVGVSRRGDLVVTDPDFIENSNLNRQFLFREKHLRKAKSHTAASAIVGMNPELQGRVRARLEKVHEGTEDIFSDAFFESMDVVTNALDNIKARVYIDKRCVSSHRALFEPGTLGPKGHVQVIVPLMTESYGSQVDPEDDNEIPFCTLRMFPEESVHCVEWALDRFTKLFSKQPQILDKMVHALPNVADDPQSLRVAFRLLSKRPRSYEDCLAFARRKFQKYFHNDILQLLHVYPLDATTKEGKPFWALPKRPPRPLFFDPSDPRHIGFVRSAAFLRAKEFGIQVPVWNEAFTEHAVSFLLQMPIAKFVPSDEKAAAISTQVEKTQAPKTEAPPAEPAPAQPDPMSDMQETSLIQDEFLSLVERECNLVVLADEFEKDVDANGHVDFLYAMTTLRCQNYSLNDMDWLQVKLKAGRIVPALVTTTAVVAGLLTVELIKHAAKVNLEARKNTFLNLAVPYFTQTEPGPPPSRVLSPKAKVTIWDRWEVKLGADITLQQLMDHVSTTYDLTVVNVLKGVKPIYARPEPGSSSSSMSDSSKPLLQLVGGNSNTKYVDVSLLVVPLVGSTSPEKPDLAPPVRVYFDSMSSSSSSSSSS